MSIRCRTAFVMCVVAVTASMTPSALATPTEFAHEPAISKQSGVGNCSPNWVNIYSFTKQPVNAWRARINGTDLRALVKDRSGRAFITIKDGDGTEARDIGWDEGHPLSVLVLINGASARVDVVITDSLERVGCAEVFNPTHKP